MSAERQSEQAAAAGEETFSLLDQITSAMPRAVQKDEASDMIRNLIDEAMRGTVVWDKSVTRTIRQAI
ncbi:MAG: hypothetical protein KDA96_11655, partial [Planctomycetaceae bacterium]|nr:hypothetical protein [Planctomycetaceae bacterium]